MTPDQALNILAEVASKYLGTQQDHINLSQAVAVLRQAITAPPKNDKKK